MATPAGWYDDGQGSLRWWDGQQWTEHVHPKPDAAPSAAPTAAAFTTLGFDETAGGSGTSAPVAADESVPGPVAEPAAEPGPELSPPAADAGVSTPGASPEYGQQPPVPTQPYGEAPYGQQPPAPGQSYGAPGAGQPYAQQPGYGQPGGAYGAPPPAEKKSNLWIVFLVIGVVLVGLIVAAAIAIPAIVRGIAGAGGGGGETGSTADEKEAVAAVELYDDAYDTGDCDEFEQATTEAYRASYEYTCEGFQQDSADFTSTVSDYVITVTDVETDGDQITVETEETYLSSLDDDGNEVDVPIPSETDYTYTLVQENGRWAIDSLE